MLDIIKFFNYFDPNYPDFLQIAEILKNSLFIYLYRCQVALYAYSSPRWFLTCLFSKVDSQCYLIWILDFTL